MSEVNMDWLDAARGLTVQGRFIEAFRLLNESDTPRRAADVLRVEVLESIGRYAQCQRLAETLVRAKDVGERERGNCQFALGLIELNNGNTDRAISRFNQAISLATATGDLEHRCWYQLRLLVT